MMLTLDDVRKSRGDGYALHIRGLDVAEGEKVAIIGPSGCGKSTTLDIIGMVLEPDSAARFSFSPADEAHDVAHIWRLGRPQQLTELRRRHVGYVLQTGEIFPFLDVRANIELTALAAGLARERARKKASELLERLELERQEHTMPAALSIGQRQRVAIARALAPSPGLLLADEPTSALDPCMARNVMRLLLETIEEYGTALIMVSHDLALVSEFDFRQAPIVTEPAGHGITAVLDG